MKPLAERFWAKVGSRTPGQCWLWTGATSKKSSGLYGHIRPAGTKAPVLACAVALELDGRPKPFEGAEPCHLCHVSLCVNPEHLEWGTHSANIKQQWERPKGQRHGSASGRANGERVRSSRAGDCSDSDSGSAVGTTVSTSEY